MGIVRICSETKTKDKPFGSYCKHRRPCKKCKGCSVYDAFLSRRAYLS